MDDWGSTKNTASHLLTLFANFIITVFALISASCGASSQRLKLAINSMMIFHLLGYLLCQSATNSLAFAPSLWKQGPLGPSFSYMSKNNDADTNTVIKADTFITTKASNLDKNLTSDERSNVNIVRSRSPSVACVTSYAVPINNNNRRRSSRTIRSARNDNRSAPGSPKMPPAGSQSLGTGSAFSVTSDGYLLTNYHVIERAYQMEQSSIRIESFYKNITERLPSFVNPPKATRKAEVYIQLDSSRDNLPCRIVAVKPENDIAILQLNTTYLESTKFNIPPPIPDGLSTDLLVGQTVLAIGNPFGLSQTVTTGVVSALDRSVKGIAGNDIRGCIQTDASINPGNSGGPLLNSNGEVVGVNTMIISTSGSSAGIGFAVPVDGFWTSIMDRIEDDRVEERLKRSYNGHGAARKKGWLGMKVVLDKNLENALYRRVRAGLEGESAEGLFVMDVDKDSPALDAGICPLEMNDGNVKCGDRIIAVNGQVIKDSQDLKREVRNRIVGEKITMTVVNAKGEKRVVYITLKEKP